jgi:hypothetical protein
MKSTASMARQVRESWAKGNLRRHCERSEAIHYRPLDCFVACAPRNDG